MSQTNARVLIIAIITAGILLLGGITWAIVASPLASNEQQTAQDGTFNPTAQDLTQINQDQRESIALDAATSIATWNPVEDTSRTDALQRASEYMTDELQDQIVATEDPPTDIEWRSAERYEATSIPEVVIVEDSHAHEHPDTDTPAYITVKVTWQWETPDGSTYAGDDISQPRYYFFAFNDDNLITDYTTTV
ncbi:MAG: hypothetical protein HLX51_01720 [Micrococcaceae bacterium]|nr:hypothetical protein [Micrococcaceae bacterium]